MNMISLSNLSLKHLNKTLGNEGHGFMACMQTHQIDSEDENKIKTQRLPFEMIRPHPSFFMGQTW